MNSVFRTLAICALVSLASASSEAFDLEFDAGGRAGSGKPSALGAVSWNAIKLGGPFAFGTSGSGEATVDVSGAPGADADFRADASYSAGNIVAGLRAEAAAFRSPETDEDWINAELSIPFTFNGSDFSLSIAPRCGAGFFDSESFNYGGNASLSYLAGDFILKPGLGAAQTLYPDGTRTIAIRPNLGIVWYPGIPLTADLSVGWNRSETESGSESTTFPVSVSISAVPFAWLCLTTRFESWSDSSGTMTYRSEGSVEFIRYGDNGAAIHLPIRGYFTRTDGEPDRYGVSVMIGYSFGGE